MGPLTLLVPGFQEKIGFEDYSSTIDFQATGISQASITFFPQVEHPMCAFLKSKGDPSLESGAEV